MQSPLHEHELLNLCVYPSKNLGQIAVNFQCIRVQAVIQNTSATTLWNVVMESSSCPVCLHELDEPASVKACGHTFCKECIWKWTQSRRQPRCPLCQADITVLCTISGEQEVKPPETLADEGPDLSCLDHAYFKAEADRLLRRASSAQLHVTRAAFGSGRRGSAAADDASSALQQVIQALRDYRHDMEAEVPFFPEQVLHELYALDSIVSSVQAGEWSSSGQQQEWAGSGGGSGARLLSADDAAAHSEAEGEEDYDHRDSAGECCYDDDPEQLDYETSRRLDRAVLGSTPGRRPTSGKARKASGGGGGRGGTPGGGSSGGGGLASRGSSGSLGGGRRR